MSLSEALPTTAMTLCRSLHAEALQATISEGLVQGPYVAARAGFEPTTLRSNGVVSTNAPPCPTWWRISVPADHIDVLIGVHHVVIQFHVLALLLPQRTKLQRIVEDPLCEPVPVGHRRVPHKHVPTHEHPRVLRERRPFTLSLRITGKQ